MAMGIGGLTSWKGHQDPTLLHVLFDLSFEGKSPATCQLRHDLHSD